MDPALLFKNIFISSLMGSFLIIFILMIKSIFRQKLNCYAHYYIWLLIMLKLVLPYGVKSSVSIYNITGPIINNNAAVSTKTYNGTAAEITSYNKSVPGKAGSDYIPNKNNAVDKYDIFFGIWLAGVLFSLFLFFYSNVKINYIIKNSTDYSDHKFDKAFAECMNIAHIKKSIRLIYTDKIGSPSLYGLFNPVIFMPVKAAENIDEHEFRYIILHELSHFKRKDLIINTAASLLKIIYWFNPIILYGFYRMKQDCEIACDAHAMSYLEKSERISYGETIIRISQLSGKAQWLPSAYSFAVNKYEIKRRIFMISRYKKLSTLSIILGIAVIMAIGVVGLSSSAARSHNVIKQQTKASKSKPEPVTASHPVTENEQSAINYDLSDSDIFTKYLTDKGYTILPNSIAGGSILLPKTFNEEINNIDNINIGQLLKDRNELSKKQGLDFSSYLGKDVTLYTCSIVQPGYTYDPAQLGSEHAEDVICLMYNNKIVAFWIVPPIKNADKSDYDVTILMNNL